MPVPRLNDVLISVFALPLDNAVAFPMKRRRNLRLSVAIVSLHTTAQAPP